MRIFIQKNIKIVLGFFIGILCGSLTVYGAYTYFASIVSFQPNDKNWKVENVEAALNDLYKIKNTPSVSLLLGTGRIRYHSSVTSLSYVPGVIASNVTDYVSLQNNKFTVKKDGNYIIFCVAGSYMNQQLGASFSGHVQVLVNDKYVMEANQSYDTYNFSHKLVSLKAGDTISAKYKANGGDYWKIAYYYIYYVG